MSKSDENRRQLFATLTEAGGRLRVRNALNPALWLCGVIGVPCLFCLGFAAKPSPIIPILLCCVVGVALFPFVFLLLTDPDRLQSEEYQLRNRTPDLIEEKGNSKAIDATVVDVISQPDFSALPEDGKEAK